MADWDPIGVSGIPEAQDEYGAYVSEVHRLLMRRQPASEIARFLHWAETEQMGLPGNHARANLVAEKLVGR